MQECFGLDGISGSNNQTNTGMSEQNFNIQFGGGFYFLNPAHT